VRSSSKAARARRSALHRRLPPPWRTAQRRDGRPCSLNRTAAHRAAPQRSQLPGERSSKPCHPCTRQSQAAGPSLHRRLRTVSRSVQPPRAACRVQQTSWGMQQGWGPRLHGHRRRRRLLGTGRTTGCYARRLPRQGQGGGRRGPGCCRTAHRAAGGAAARRGRGGGPSLQRSPRRRRRGSPSAAPRRRLRTLPSQARRLRMARSPRCSALRGPPRRAAAMRQGRPRAPRSRASWRTRFRARRTAARAVAPILARRSPPPATTRTQPLAWAAHSARPALTHAPRRPRRATQAAAVAARRGMRCGTASIGAASPAAPLRRTRRR